MNQIVYIRDEQALADYCANLPRASQATHQIALDTEFERRNTWRARLALLQLYDGHRVALVDALALRKAPVADMLFTKDSAPFLMHAPGEDYDILLQNYGATPGTIYDTQLAAAFLGFDLCMSYRALVHSVLDVQLDKSLQTSDWIQRPLKPEQLRYAANDVIHLPALWRELESRLRAGDHWNWFLEETEAVQCNRRDKSAREPTDVRSAILHWREQEAEQHDIPANWVLCKQHLRDIMRLSSPSVNDVAAVLRQKPGRSRASANKVHRTLSRARADFPNPPRRPVISKTLLQRAQVVVSNLAEQHCINPSLLATQKQLQHFITQPENSISGWRADLLQPALRRLVS